MKKKRFVHLCRTPTANKEDFLGWMFHPLLLVPIAGAELKVTLMSQSKKPRNGFITLFLSIQADTEEKSLEVQSLTQILFNMEAEKGNFCQSRNLLDVGPTGPASHKLQVAGSGLSWACILQLTSMWVSSLVLGQEQWAKVCSRSL